MESETREGKKVATLFGRVLILMAPLSVAWMSGCVVEQGAKTKANCDPGSEFDVISRSCAQAASINNIPPMPTGTSEDVSGDEDSGVMMVDLNYSDIDGDLASGCDARSLTGLGIRKYLELSSIRFFSRPSVLDAHNTYIRLRPSGVGTVVVTPTVGMMGTNAIRRVDIEYNAGMHGQGDVINALRANMLVNTFVEVTSMGVDVLSDSGGFRNLTTLPCTCSGGFCLSQITPVDNFPAKSLNNVNLDVMLSVYNLWPAIPGGQAMGDIGYSDFEYRVSDKDGASDWRLVDIQVNEVNDPPNVIGMIMPLNVNEPQDTDFTFSYNLQTGAGLTFEEFEEQPIHFCTITPANLGTSILNMQTGVLDYRVGRDSNGTDSFVFRACDNNSCQGQGCTADQTLNIAVAPTADPFRGGNLLADRGIMLAPFDEDGTTDIGVLFFEDTDGGETAVGCQFELADSVGVFASTDCACTAGVCSIGITGKNHFHGGAARVAYRITSNNPMDSLGDLSFYTVAIRDVDDPPVAFGTLDTVSGVTHTAVYQDGNNQSANLTGRLRFNESSSHLPPQVSFTIAPPFLADAADGDTVLSYTLVSQPSNGVISDCMGLDGSSATDLECVYTPKDGNLSDIRALMDTFADKGFVNTASGSLRFVSREFGDSSSSLQVQLIDAEAVGGGNEEVWVDGNTVKILYEAGISTSANVATAFAATAAASARELLELQVLAVGVLPAGDEQIYTLSAGTATADRFTYQVRDSDGIVSADKNFHISITPVDDRPVVCEYSSYSEQPNCGLNGCIGGDVPTGLTGVSEGASYYDTSTSACWRYLSGTWTLVKSFIRDRSINELQTIIIDRIVVDEGGGDAAENAQSTRLVGITSSNPTLLPVNNVHLIYDGNVRCDTLADNCHGGSLATPIAFETTTNAQDFRLSLHVVPVMGQTGSADIELTFDDGTRETEVEFQITVNPTSATHGGWNGISATGPKVDTYGNVVEDRRHCPYSLDLCEGGTVCRGLDNPVGATMWTPDNVNSVYLQEQAGDASGTCFRVRRTPVQHISYAPKTSDYVSIEYVSGATAGSETVSVNGAGTATDPYRIRVDIEDEGSTTDQIIAAIVASTNADRLVLALNRNPGETQDVQSSVSLGSLSESAWEVFETTCSITPTDFESNCSAYGQTCQGVGRPTITPTIIDARYWDEGNNRCYRSKGTTGATDWIAYDAAAEIALSWNKFGVSGSGLVSSYQVFRRLANTEFDYDLPINRQTIEGGISETFRFVDNHQNSVFPPIPNTVYYYQIRPIINDILTTTNQIFSTVRVMAPPKNMAFVHRWMANKAICDLLQSTPNPVQDYACPYRGPGDTALAGDYVYDLGSDLLVDRFEAGCAFGVSPTCSGNADGSCIGIEDPSTTTPPITANNGSVYYAREDGACYLRAGGAWTQINDTDRSTDIDAYLTAVDNRPGVATDPQNDETTDIDSNRPFLPPFTNVTQETAYRFCDRQADILADEIYGVRNTLERKLPNRKEQIAYSQWESGDNITEAEKGALESGLALHASSKCNSSSASGLEHAYTDINIPDSNNYYSLAGTHSSQIRSMVTGPHQTRACTSQFGVQDAVGNVAEWISMRISCSVPRGTPTVTARLSACREMPAGVMRFALEPANFYQSAAGTAEPFGTWALDGVRAPCVDRDGDSICDHALTDWKIKEERLGAGRFIIPLGLPAQSDFLLDNPTSEANLVEIGPTSGITSAQLHDDHMSFHTERIFASDSTNDCAGMATGGHYGSGAEAGVFSSEFLACGGNAFGYLTIQDISFRAKTSSVRTISILFEDNTATSGIVVNGTTSVVVDLADLANRTARQVVTELNNDAGFTAILEAAVSGDPDRNQSAFANPLNLIDVSDESHNRRVDIGFRCLTPIDSSDYDE